MRTISIGYVALLTSLLNVGEGYSRFTKKGRPWLQIPFEHLRFLLERKFKVGKIANVVGTSYLGANAQEKTNEGYSIHILRLWQPQNIFRHAC